MVEVMNKENLFDPELVKDLINKVKGKSSLSALSAQEAVSFNGNKEFIFNFDKEIDIVAESGKKTAGGMSLEPVTIVPIKFEYSSRVSDEFLFATEEEQLDILKAFNDGFAKKIAKGLDIAAMHGINPRTGEKSSVIGDNNFDAKVTQTVTYNSETPDDTIDTAIDVVEGSECEVSGIVIDTTVRSDMSKVKNKNGEVTYPEFRFGGKPSTLGSQTLEVNKTVSTGTGVTDKGIVGDFASMFKWGYSKEIPLEIIKYGDPDSSGKDLKAYGQVCLRSEVYLGWGILDGKSFARMVTA